MELKVDTKMIHHVNYGDLEKFLTAVFGRSVEIGESDNDTSHQFNRIGMNKAWQTAAQSAEEAKETVTELVKKGYLPIWRTGDVLEYLASQGKVLPGDYVIRVSW